MIRLRGELGTEVYPMLAEVLKNKLRRAQRFHEDEISVRINGL